MEVPYIWIILSHTVYEMMYFVNPSFCSFLQGEHIYLSIIALRDTLCHFWCTDVTGGSLSFIFKHGSCINRCGFCGSLLMFRWSATVVLNATGRMSLTYGWRLAIQHLPETSCEYDVINVA